MSAKRIEEIRTKLEDWADDVFSWVDGDDWSYSMNAIMEGADNEKIRVDDMVENLKERFLILYEEKIEQIREDFDAAHMGDAD